MFWKSLLETLSWYIRVITRGFGWLYPTISPLIIFPLIDRVCVCHYTISHHTPMILPWWNPTISHTKNVPVWQIYHTTLLWHSNDIFNGLVVLPGTKLWSYTYFIAETAIHESILAWKMPPAARSMSTGQEANISRSGEGLRGSEIVSPWQIHASSWQPITDGNAMMLVALAIIVKNDDLTTW